MTEPHPPEGPRPSVHVVRLTRALGVRLTVYGTALLYAAILVALSFDAAGTHHIDSWVALTRIAVSSLTTIVATIVLHEAVHGVFMRMCGGRPRFGVGCIGWLMPYAYAISPGSPFTLYQMTLIGLAPLVLLSSLALGLLWLVPTAFGPAALAFVTNVSGSVGDLWMVGLMWRFRGCRDLTFVDALDSMSVHTPDPRGTAIAAELASSHRGRGVRRVLLRWIVATSVLLSAVIPLGIVLSLIHAPDMTVGPAPFPLVSYQTMNGEGLSMQVNVPAIAVAGLLITALSLPFGRRRHSVQPHPAGPTTPPHPAFL